MQSDFENNDKLYVKGKLLPEPYLENNYKKAGIELVKHVQPILCLKFLRVITEIMGNYRDIAKDFGPIKRKAIIGKVVFCYWPLNKIQAF